MGLHFRLMGGDGPTLDMGNASAAALLRALGLPDDVAWGELASGQLDAVIDLCMKLANGVGLETWAIAPKQERGELRAGEVEGNVVELRRGALCIDFGVDEDRLKRRASEFYGLLVAARRQGVGVEWG